MLLALAQHGDALDDLLDDALGQRRGARHRRLVEEGLDGVVLLVLVGDQLALQRLRQFRAVAVERVGLEAELPRHQIGRLAVLDRGVVRHVDGLRDRARDERLRRRHHADVALDREIALAGAAARIGAVEHRVVLGLEVRRAFDRHRAADVDVGGVDLALGEAEMGEQVELRIGEVFGRDFQRVAAEFLAERPLVERELDVERGRQRLLDLGDGFVVKALLPQGGVVDAGRLAEIAVADGIGFDLGDVAFAVAERAQRFRHRAVDDLEVAAAGELLELHQREVRLDAGGVAIHHEADGAGRRDDGRLRIAVAVLLRRARARRPRPSWRARRGAGNCPASPSQAAWSSRTGGCAIFS